MTDIVERLRGLDRDAYDWFAVVDKAADTIERLRADCPPRPGAKAMTDTVEWPLSIVAARETIIGQKAEIARLRNDYSILKRDYDSLREDNERLRALEQKP